MMKNDGTMNTVQQLVLIKRVKLSPYDCSVVGASEGNLSLGCQGHYIKHTQLDGLMLLKRIHPVM